MAIRVTQAELDAFDANYVRGGLMRSEVIRSKLGISVARKRRGEMSPSDTYDYQRALLMKNSTNKIILLIDWVNTISSDRDRLTAISALRDLVFREVKKIEKELDSLQLKSGVTYKKSSKFPPTEPARTGESP